MHFEFSYPSLFPVFLIQVIQNPFNVLKISVKNERTGSGLFMLFYGIHQVLPKRIEIDRYPVIACVLKIQFLNK